MKKKLLISFILLLLVYSIGGIIYNFYNENPKKDEKETISIDDYPYVMPSNYNKQMKEEFLVLKNILENEYDEKDYIEQLSRIFLYDLYTINNKNNDFDVTSKMYIHPDFQDNFELYISDTLYKNIKHQSIKKSDLPEVSKVTVIEVNKESELTTILLTIDYKEDLSYSSEEKLTLQKENGIYYIISNKEN